MDDNGQYGDYFDLKVGQRVRLTIIGEITEVGSNYAEVLSEDGEEYAVGNNYPETLIEVLK